MTSRVLGIVVAGSCLLASAAVRADEPTLQDPDQKKPKVGSVVTGTGQTPEKIQEGGGPGVSFGVDPYAPPPAPRGRSWWPYPEDLRTYGAPERRAELMGENEISINGVATIDVRDPDDVLKQLPRDLILRAGEQVTAAEGFYLVKIKGFSRTTEQVEALRAAGAVLGEYLNINTYITKIGAGELAAVRALPFVTYVGDYHPAYKISPRIGLELMPPDEVTAKDWALEVTVHEGASVDAVVASLAAQGIFVEAGDIVAGGAGTAIVVRTAPETIPALASIPGVKWLAEKTFPRVLASSVSPVAIPMLLQNNGTFTTNTLTGWKLWNFGLDGRASGTAQIVTMMDTGLNTSMEHFAQDTTTTGTPGPSHRKVVGYDVYGGDQCVTAYTGADGGHGTWTSQHAVGSISNMTSNPDVTHTPNGNWDDGIARGAKVYFQDIGIPSGSIAPPLDLAASITAAIGKGSFIQNHSWGSSSPTYDTQASNLDAAMFANPGMVVTVAAGNNGTGGVSTIGSPSTAKNVIAVGGADAANSSALFEDCLWDGSASCGGVNDLGSARGPVLTSNRVKPDIITFTAFSASVGGENEAGNRPHAMCQTDASKPVYWDFSNGNGFGGTSFAAPEVAGLAAIVRDYFVAGFYPTGSATPANTLNPTGALVKAVILASGEDMSTVASPTNTINNIGKRYSNDVGYGRANLSGVLHVGSGAPFLWVKNNDALGSGLTKSSFYNINGNGTALRVMLAFYDAAGNALQKDADLKVKINGVDYWGNNLTGGWSTSATSTRDHTNTTEGVFLDAAHGLPASGSIQVDVIGFNNPGGMTYSLAVVGDVASQDVTQVSLDKGKYTCSDTIAITVNDSAATSPVSVTLVSKNGGGTTIDTQIVSCSGSGGVFMGSIATGSGIAVVDGGSLVATYVGAAAPASALVDCQLDLSDGGFLIAGGCDNGAAGNDFVTGPLSTGGTNEFYNKYMDGGEYTAYTVGFNNLTGEALSDVSVTLSFSGPGASKMTALNNPVHVGGIPADGLAGAVFQIFTDPSVAGLTSVNLDFDITSTADGYSTVKRVTQVQRLQANDVISRQQSCATFNTSLSPFFESALTGAVTNPWRWSGAATTPATVGSELRTDGACGSATANAAAMIGNSGTTVNFSANADSVLAIRFQPALTGNGPNGQPYHYVWKWHSFYKASETLGNQSGGWGTFYNDQWNLAVNPTGDQVTAFPYIWCCFYHTEFDYVGTWNWDAANGGTPDDPRLGPTSGGAPNQYFVGFDPDTTGLATSSTWFSYGHEHFQVTSTTHRDIALDNDRFVYDEYYTAAQAGASCGGGGQLGQVSFDRYSYDDCPASSAVLSVVDVNAAGPVTVTVTSPGTGDSEVVTLTGAGPLFTGTLTLATNAGSGANNGTLFVLPGESVSVTYTDAAPAGTTTAQAIIGCPGGDVTVDSTTQVSDNGDNDGTADNNETVTIDITITNHGSSPITNTKVKIIPVTSTIDCASDDQALYGTVAAGASATNPPGDRFTFHIAPAVACSDWQNAPLAKFVVLVSADGFDGTSTLQVFNLTLDLDSGVGGTYSLSQNFATDPGWLTTVTPDDGGGCNPPYGNSFHWCAACGNAGGGYGAWTGNSAFGTVGQQYPNFDSATLNSPVLTAAGNVTLSFQVAYRNETQFDGAIVQSKVGNGAWTALGFTTPAQAATTTNSAFCSPLAAGELAWTGNGVSWTTTNTATVTASAGQAIQFRWRNGADSVNGGSSYGGYGVDNVTIGNLQQTLICEPTRNTGLPGCGPACSAPSSLTNNAAADLSAQDDTGVLVTWSVDAGNWGDGGSGTRTYDVLRDGNPIATGVAYGTTSYTDTTGVDGQSYSYSVRYKNGCGSTATTAGASASDAGCACVASDQCHQGGVCDGNGLCLNPNKANGSPCNDANACTLLDTCQLGVCQGGTPVVCGALDQCHIAGTCDTGTGLCSDPPAADGTGCSDGNACTQTDSCQAGLCAGTNPVVCGALDQCHVAGTCDTGTGLCSDPPAADGTGCSDGNACTAGDSCQAGACAPGAPVPPPAEVDNGVALGKLAGSATISWNTAGGATASDVLRGLLSGLPVGPGGGDESCLGSPTSPASDSDVPAIGTGFWYLIRGTNACGQGTYGFRTAGVVPTTERVSTTCP